MWQNWNWSTQLLERCFIHAIMVSNGIPTPQPEEIIIMIVLLHTDFLTSTRFVNITVLPHSDEQIHQTLPL